MSYHIYTTNALILSNWSMREADRVYSILTEDFGLVRATATGVRKEKSKLRHALEPLSFSKVSLVKGKGYWRITSALLEYNIPEKLFERKAELKSLARVFDLLEKLVIGEDVHPELISESRKAVDFIVENSLEKREKDIEVFLASRILFELGYISEEEIPENFVVGEISKEHLDIARDNRKDLIKAINKGIESSHLTK